MKSYWEELKKIRIPFWYEGVSALDQYYKVSQRPFLFLLSEGTLVDLAKVFPTLKYPSKEHVDAALDLPNGEVLYFRFLEAQGKSWTPHPIFSVLYDLMQGKYLDKLGVYGMLRKRQLPENLAGQLLGFEAALLVARYGFDLSQKEAFLSTLPTETPLLDLDEQRDLLSLILTGKYAAEGLKVLLQTGYLHRYWPELMLLQEVSHSKEYHPEGDVWEHTTETFSYRKHPDLAISLALLLHDVGKPHAQTQEGRKFDRHAEIGTQIAHKFLRRLKFPDALITKVLFLIRNHMMPGGLKTLPIYRVEKVLESEWFPDLLEVYRCDLSSTFRGPGGYYEACKIYRAYLRNKKNPFRTVEGKKIQRFQEPRVVQSRG